MYIFHQFIQSCRFYIQLMFYNQLIITFLITQFTRYYE